MRISTTAALLLPALASAQYFDVPAYGSQLSSFWNKISSYLPGYMDPYNVAPFSSRPKTALSREVVALNAKNWAAELGAQPASAWMILVTGGNTTCGGRCGQLDEAWTAASAAARADARAPALGRIDCESNRLLCATWGAAPAEVWWVEPEVRTSRTADTNAARVTAREAEVEGATPLDSLQEVSRDIYVVKLNTTTVAAPEIARLYRASEYKTRGELLESDTLLSRHPYNSQLAKLGLNVPVGYVMFAVGLIPSWSLIMLLSFSTRMFMQRSQNKNRAETREQKEERERKEKYQENGKVRGAPPGDGRSTGVI